MKSVLPKVLHKVGGRPVLSYVLDVVRSLKTYVVVGHGAQDVKKTIGDAVEYVLQDQLLGTGDAVKRVLPHLKNFSGNILVLCGDTPLLEKPIISRLMAVHKSSKAAATVLSAVIQNPKGYGRMVRDEKGRLLGIREQKDASAEEDRINEINVGVYCFKAKDLFSTLRGIKLNALKKEYYLTDVIELLLADGKKVASVVTKDETVAFGINTRADLAQAERIIRQRILNKLMDCGVTIVDPATTYVETGVVIGRDTVIYPCTYIHHDVTIGSHCQIGPFARIRPGSCLADYCEVGNFAEVSRTRMGQKVMMKHFSFLGDANIGRDVNIGAGTITANYDGVNKNKTVIEDGAFIGSDTVLVAPAAIGKRALIGAGSLVKKGSKIPAGSVALGVPARVIRKRD